MEHKYYGKPLNWERSGFSSTIVNYECPRCGAPKEHYCKYPYGGRKWPPHTERFCLLTEEQREKTRIEAHTVTEVIENISKN